MNFYDVILAGKLQDVTYPVNFFDLLFARKFYPADVWETYEGTLPATFNANGSDMRQYQIYGADGSVGDKTANLFDYKKLMPEYTYNTNGELVINPDKLNRNIYSATPKIAVEPNKTYVRTYNGAIYGNIINFYDINGDFIQQVRQNPFTTPNNCGFISYVVKNQNFGNDVKKYMITPGTTVPASYIPYGYEVDMSTSDGTNTETTPIYIGDTALQKDEYVDYKAGKIYRKIDNVLTPTDPPVALPALPTCDGTTIVDYAGQSVAVPEKVLFEYKSR